MTEPERTQSGLIKVPAAYEQERKRSADREKALGELREWLAQEHANALEAKPLATFKTRLPLEVLQNLTEREREQLLSFEQRTFDQQKSIARQKDEQKRAFVSAGGDPEAFEADWAWEGRDATIAAGAADNLERLQRASSPYS